MDLTHARRLSVAPMMDWTDRHCRAFHRAFSSQTLLYTEMVTTGAVLHGDRARLIGFDPLEQPVALQLGGSDPHDLAEAARIGEAEGYAEINLNVGCPSDRVQSGRFGACLMREPQLVAACMAAMARAVAVPVTVKCRIGVDDQSTDEGLFSLVGACADAGVQTFIVHARKAWLKGLSPKENRDVPPLDYAVVRRLKAQRPDLSISINGGIADLDQAEGFLTPSDEGPALDGVMLGRAAYHEPALLGQADRRIFGVATADIGPFAAIAAYRPYLASRLEAGVHLSAMTRHMLGTMHGRPGARAFRRILTVEAAQTGAGLEVVDRALDAVREAEARRQAA
ncbi:MAG: tRNA dihydrouridine(20/20a) synthase DusA [Caulobacterales bacterium]|nr:tRNA dihydrouridine(20/20a) synthase DusA [Caulobacterales bacterium]